MDMDSGEQREVRAARNQALFRAVNGKLTESALGMEADFVIACECADVMCVEALDITSDAYRAVRANPRRFAVLRGHVYRDVEVVVEETDGYVVVDKLAEAGKVAEQLASS
jgi:hypothetical protein